MKQQVLRKTISAGGWTEFKFNQPAKTFFVKNFSEEDILVTFEDDEIEAEAFKIPAGMAEEIAVSYNNQSNPKYLKDAVYVKGVGEVEVEELDV